MGGNKPQPPALSSLAGCLQSEFAHGDLQVGPGFLLLSRVAQQIRRVIGHDKLGSANGMDSASAGGPGPAEISKPR